MSRKIDKKLREAANKEHQEIRDSSQTFLDEVLLPKFEANKQKMALAKQSSRRSGILRYGLIAAPLIVVIVILIALLVPSPETGYLGPFETEPSDLQTVNQTLIETKLSGEFETITLSYHPETKKTMCFTLAHQAILENSFIQSEIEITIERSLSLDFEKTHYQNRLSFLGYEVKYNEAAPQSTYDDMPVFEFIVQAYFDTGEERFFIQYYELTVNEYSSFGEYLAALVQSKK